MIGSTRNVRVFAYAGPADLRKGYNGLYGLVRKTMERDPLSGDLYLFTNRRRSSCKVLMFDGTGLCLFCKRLEKPGKFAPLWRESGGEIELTQSELALYLEGCRQVGYQRLSPPSITAKPVQVVSR